ncbi:MAG: cyclic nucleotide-binding domain-containing protein [Candidatus Wallbacteria bacterium]|nr:cyclic nucleotide-binding domain-containing protein [Candidatus Wallbacteria bacterium]
MITSDKFAVLRDLSFFKEFADDELQTFLSICAEKVLKEGEKVFLEGSIGEEFFIIVSGQVAIVKESDSGERQLLTVLERGGVFGEMSIIDNSPRSACAEVIDSNAELLIVKKKFLEDLSKRNLDLSVKLILTLIQFISERLRMTSERFAFAQSTLKNLEG